MEKLLIKKLYYFPKQYRFHVIKNDKMCISNDNK